MRSASAHRTLARSVVAGAVALTSLSALPLAGLAVQADAPISTGTQLAFVAQPATAAPGLRFAAQPVVAIEDASGNTVTGATTTVTLSLGVHPGGSKLTCTGGPWMATSNGVATFSGCLISTAGTGYTLVASAAGLGSATSAPFDVQVITGTLSIAASQTVLNVGQSSTITVNFGTAGANAPIRLERKTPLAATYGLLATLTTDATGMASTPVTPDVNTWYEAYFPGNSGVTGATSTPIMIGVRRSIDMHGVTPSGTRTVSPGRQLVFRATIRPLHGGGRVTFRIYHWDGRRWVAFSSATITADAQGHASFTRTWNTAGRWRVRAVANATAFNLAALSNFETIIVR